MVEGVIVREFLRRHAAQYLLEELLLLIIQFTIYLTRFFICITSFVDVFHKLVPKVLHGILRMVVGEKT